MTKGETQEFAISVDRQLHVSLEDNQSRDRTSPTHEVRPMQAQLLLTEGSESCLHGMFICYVIEVSTRRYT